MEMSTPSVVTSPLKRLREASGYTQAKLAKEFGITPYLVHMAEQSVYAEPPPRLLMALKAVAPVGFDEPSIREAYYGHQMAIRVGNYGKLDERYFQAVRSESISSVSHEKHPLIDWREYSGISSNVAISKLYCVHPALIHRFESAPYRCSSIPGELLTALRISGYSEQALAAFTDLYATYFANLSERVSSESRRVLRVVKGGVK